MSTIIDHFLFFSDTVSGDTLKLDSEETRHAISVLRVQAGDKIFVTDGIGWIYFCRIEHIDKKSCTTQILERKAQEPPQPAMHFFVGIPEKEAFENTLLGLVPLGVMHITPVICQTCQKKWWKKQWEKQATRFRKKMISAAKQSWNGWLPQLNGPIPFESAVAKVGNNVLVADERGETLDRLSGNIHSCDVLSCFIGPPGGFSDEEREIFLRKKAHCIKLSDRRLRTELAATILAGNIVQKFSIT